MGAAGQASDHGIQAILSDLYKGDNILKEMKILLLNPYYSFTGDTYVFYRASVPYGLIAIESYLKQKGLSAKIYELGIFDEEDVILEWEGRARCGVQDKQIKRIIYRENPDIIGISTMYTVFHQDYIDLIQYIKKLNPNIRIVVGGNHASSFPQMMLDAGADQVVVGEGEIAFLDICNGDKSAIVSRDLIPDLDMLPLPDMSAIDFPQYFQASNPFTMRQPVAGVMTSRGCPHDCCYCTANGVWRRKWRGKSPEYVIDEITELVWKYGIQEIHFMDDNMAVSKERLRAICNEIIDADLYIKWAMPNGIPYWQLDNDTLDLMKRSGCYRLTFGIESGDPEIRKYIGKEFPLAKAKEVIQYANKIGIWTICTNIIGFPYETEEQIRRTIDFAKDCGTDFATFFTLLPHPSSRVYQDFLKEGLVDPADAMSALNEGGARTVRFSKQEIKDFQRKAYNEFVDHRIHQYLKHPGQMLRKIRSIEDLVYVYKMGIMGISMKLKRGQKIATTKDYIYGRKQYVK